MKLKWTRRALQQLVEAQNFIARENPAAAQEIAARINDATRVLLGQPRLGRPGRVGGTREWVVGRTQYLIVYTLEPEVLCVLRIIHSKQHWNPGDVVPSER